MKKVTIDTVNSNPSPASVKKKLTEELETTHFALTYYELEPGESSAFGYHAHEQQEEVFYIQQGAVTIRTETQTCTVTAGELARVPPGELQQCINEADERARMVVIGGPKDAGKLTLRRYCDVCDQETPHDVRTLDGGGGRETICLTCGHVTGRFTS